MTDKFEKYYQELCQAFDNNEWHFTQNRDRAHNATIMRVMLEKADSIKMYCGELSVFRKSFYRHINTDYPGYGEIVKGQVEKALNSFLERPKSRLTIIIENYSEEIFNDFIIDPEKFKRSLAVEITYLPENVKNKNEIPHIVFTADERMVRLELNKKTHEAICKIGFCEEVSSTTKPFNTLLELSTKIA